ncbi:MAG: AtpZ/AtpI family protein [Nitriliruptor sp.]|nr:MAG: AtpZ/AtpI family protein [Nitriliruptor sp.]
MATTSPPADTRPTSVSSVVGSSMKGLDQASIMGMELMAAVVVWAGIGWLVDGWLGTTPWALVIGALIGNAAGLYLVFLRGNQMEGYRDLPKAKDLVQAARDRQIHGR